MKTGDISFENVASPNNLHTRHYQFRTFCISSIYKCSSPSIIRIMKSRRMRWKSHVARMGERRNAHMLMVGRPEEKRPLGRPRRRWVDNNKMDLGRL
jgi:hypothetical protein